MIRVNLAVPFQEKARLLHNKAVINKDAMLAFAIGTQREAGRMTFAQRGRKSCFGDRKNRPGRSWEHADAMRADDVRTLKLAAPIQVKEGDQPTAAPEAGAPIFGASE